MTGVLMVYPALCAALVAATAFAWRATRQQRAGAALSDVELGALNGGALLAVLTALATLRQHHVTRTVNGRVVADRPLPADAGELERELFEALGRTPCRASAATLSDAIEGEAAQRILAKLADDGLRLGEVAAAWMRFLFLGAVWLTVCGVAGSTALLATGSGGPLERAAVTITALAMACVACWIGTRRSGPTAAGDRLLRRAAASSRAPARWEQPRSDRGRVSLAVALSGSAALWSAYPAYAAALGVPALVPSSLREQVMVTAAAANCGFVSCATASCSGGGGGGGGCGGCGCG